MRGARSALLRVGGVVGPAARQAIEQIRAWTRGEVTMSQSRAAGGHAMAAARVLSGAARHAAFAAGQAAAVAHVAAHELGAAAYAIKAARVAAPAGETDSAGRLERTWQREQLPDAIRELVLDDQRLRNGSAGLCSSVDCAAVVVALSSTTGFLEPQQRAGTRSVHATDTTRRALHRLLYDIDGDRRDVVA